MATSVAGPLPQRFDTLPSHGIVAGLQTRLHPDYLHPQISQAQHAFSPLTSQSCQSVLAQYLLAELAERRVMGPYPKSAFSEAQISRFGVIPKGNQPNKWR